MPHATKVYETKNTKGLLDLIKNYKWTYRTFPSLLDALKMISEELLQLVAPKLRSSFKTLLNDGVFCVCSKSPDLKHVKNG